LHSADGGARETGQHRRGPAGVREPPRPAARGAGRRPLARGAAGARTPPRSRLAVTLRTRWEPASFSGVARARGAALASALPLRRALTPPSGAAPQDSRRPSWAARVHPDVGRLDGGLAVRADRGTLVGAPCARVSRSPVGAPPPRRPGRTRCRRRWAAGGGGRARAGR